MIPNFHGHSGDKWNDVADELATLGQDLDLCVRTGCEAGRYANTAPRTLLTHDPRTDGTTQLVPTATAPSALILGCVDRVDEPNATPMRRVTRL